MLLPLQRDCKVEYIDLYAKNPLKGYYRCDAEIDRKIEPQSVKKTLIREIGSQMLLREREVDNIEIYKTLN